MVQKITVISQSKAGKKVTSLKILPFPEKCPPGWTTPFEFWPELPGFPYKWKALKVTLATNLQVNNSTSACSGQKLTSFIIGMATRNHWWYWFVFVFVFLILLFSWRRLYRCRTFFFLSLLREFPPMDTNTQFSPKKDEALYLLDMKWVYKTT